MHPSPSQKQMSLTPHVFIVLHTQSSLHDLYYHHWPYQRMRTTPTEKAAMHEHLLNAPLALTKANVTNAPCLYRTAHAVLPPRPVLPPLAISKNENDTY